LKRRQTVFALLLIVTEDVDTDYKNRSPNFFSLQRFLAVFLRYDLWRKCQYRGSPRGFGEQGNIGKISKGTREHQPFFGNRGTKFKKLQRGTNNKNVWEHGNIGQFWKGTWEQRPPWETLSIR